MKIGISSYTYSWAVGRVPGYPKPERPVDAQELLRRAEKFGVQVVQIADNIPLEELSIEQLDVLRRQADNSGIIIEAGTRGVRPETLLPFLDVAERLGAHLIRTLLHDASGCPSIEEAEANIRTLLPELRKRGQVLAVENHDFFPTKALRDLVCAINDPCVGICLDSVNNFAQGEGTAEVFMNLAPLTVNFHCKDYEVKRIESTMGFDVTGAPSGEGLLDLKRCKELLPDDDLSFIIELWTPWQGDIEKTVELEALWAARSVENLKKLVD